MSTAALPSTDPRRLSPQALPRPPVKTQFLGRVRGGRQTRLPTGSTPTPAHARPGPT